MIWEILETVILVALVFFGAACLLGGLSWVLTS